MPRFPIKRRGPKTGPAEWSVSGVPVISPTLARSFAKTTAGRIFPGLADAIVHDDRWLQGAGRNRKFPGPRVGPSTAISQVAVEPQQTNRAVTRKVIHANLAFHVILKNDPGPAGPSFAATSFHGRRTPQSELCQSHDRVIEAEFDGLPLLHAAASSFKGSRLNACELMLQSLSFVGYIAKPS